MQKEEYFTIQEYNKKTKEYITIGEIRATSRELAKLKFIAETGYISNRNTYLFVKTPIYR